MSERKLGRPYEHGMSGTPLWNIWKRMKANCYRETADAYERYGGKGVTVCDRWKDDFQAFYDDMGESYQPGLQLKLAEGAKEFNKETCSWITPEEAVKHRSNAHYVDSVFGKKSLRELSELSGVDEATIYTRLKEGCPIEYVTATLGFQYGPVTEYVKQCKEDHGATYQIIDGKLQFYRYKNSELPAVGKDAHTKIRKLLKDVERQFSEVQG